MFRVVCSPLFRSPADRWASERVVCVCFSFFRRFAKVVVFGHVWTVKLSRQVGFVGDGVPPTHPSLERCPVTFHTPRCVFPVWLTHTGGGNGGNHWRALKPIDDDVDETFHNCPHIIAPTRRRLPGAERWVANVCRRIIKNPVRRGTINMIPSLPGICPICACVSLGSIGLWFYMCGGREVHVHHTHTPIIGTQLQLLH